MQTTSPKRRDAAPSGGSGVFRIRRLLDDPEARIERECFPAVISIAPHEVAAPACIFHNGEIHEDFISRTETMLQLASVACFHPDGASRLAAVEHIGKYEASEMLSVVEASKYDDARSAAVRELERKMRDGTSLGRCPRSTSLIARHSSDPEHRAAALTYLAKDPFWGRSAASSLLETALLTKHADTSEIAAKMAAGMYGPERALTKLYIKAMLVIARPVVRSLERLGSWLESVRNPNNNDLPDHLRVG